MGFATGVCLPSLRHDQPGPGEGEGLPESGAHTHCSLLAPTSVVSGAARVTDSASSSSSLSVGPSASTTRQKVPSELVHASFHAWRLSGDSREPPASLVAWLDDFGRRGDSLR